MTPHHRQMETISVFVHGVLTGLHLLGVLYNVKKRNWRDVTAHTCAVAYDAWALSNHLRTLGEDHDVASAPHSR